MPNTIADNLQRLVDARTAIGNAITSKGGTVATGDGFEAFSADIATIPSGGGGGADAGKPVRFIDYGGNVVDSYTASEFAALTAMPSNPSHEGLTAQGWNWSLANAKTYVASYGKLDIGQMYITDDGRTRLYVRMQEGRLSPILKLYLNANSELDIDWGDGTAHSTFTSTSADYKSEQHNYASAGDYVVSIGVTSGSFVLQSSSSNISTLFTAGKRSSSSADMGYLNSIEKVEIGSGVTSIEIGSFYYCSSLSQITIPESVTSIGAYAFQNCYSLSQVTIPESVTSIGAYAFMACRLLSQVAIPEGVTSIGAYAFQSCTLLSQVTIHEGVTNISNNAFSNCTSLSQVTIPEGVTSIGAYTFQNCYSLSQVTIPESVTSIGSTAFQNCYSLSQVTIHEGVTSIGAGAFSNCYSLSQVTIPESVTSIGAYAFQNCYSLSQVTIPENVTSIGAGAFSNCYSVGYVKFESQTPPTVAASSVWSAIPKDCKILVPMGTLSAYTSATNYPSSSTYTYEEYDV